MRPPPDAATIEGVIFRAEMYPPMKKAGTTENSRYADASCDAPTSGAKPMNPTMLVARFTVNIARAAVTTRIVWSRSGGTSSPLCLTPTLSAARHGCRTARVLHLSASAQLCSPKLPSLVRYSLLWGGPPSVNEPGTDLFGVCLIVLAHEHRHVAQTHGAYAVLHSAVLPLRICQ